jgi:hypothetical protein
MNNKTIMIPRLVQDYINEVTNKYGSIIFKYKSSSVTQKLISYIVFVFNPSYMTSYITILGNTFWIPDDFLKSPALTILEVVTHETIHKKDTKNDGKALFWFLYASPQVWAIPAFLIILGLVLFLKWCWLLIFLSLIFVAPWPAYWRYKYELRGYRTTLLFAKYIYNVNSVEMQTIKNQIAGQLSEKWYYFIWPFKNSILKELNDNSYETLPEYQEIIEFLRRHNIIP